MKQKRLKNYLKLGILILGTSLLFTNCQKDDTSSGQDENAETLKNNVKSSYVSGDEIPDIINLLGHDSNTTSRTDASKSSTVSSPFGSLSIENILEVIDTLGNKKYSFKLIPKTPKVNSIFNLVIDASNEPINIAILEYRMAPNFAQDYHDGLKTFSEFTGSIIEFPFSPDLASNGFSRTSGDTCIQNIDEVVDCSIINLDGGTAVVGGGGGGSTTLYDTNTFTGANGGSSGSSGNGSYVVWVCDAYHVSHSNPGECSVDGGSGTWIVVIYPDSYTYRSSNSNKSSTENCCDETVVVGEIGVNFFDLGIEIRTALNIPGRSQEGLWLTGYATDTQLAELNNYIENNKDSNGNLSPEEQEFGKFAIEAMSSNNDLEFDFLEHLYNGMDKECQGNIVVNFTANTNTTITNFIVNTFNGNNTFNLEIADTDLPPNIDANAATSPPAGVNFDENTAAIIRYDNSYLNNATDLSIAMITAHEFIHVYLIHQYAQGTLLTNYPDYTVLNNAFQAFQNNSNDITAQALSDAMHDVYDDFLDWITESVYAYALDNNITEATEDYCNKLVLGNHPNSSTYQALTNNQQTEYTQITLTEQNGNEEAKGTPCN